MTDMSRRSALAAAASATAIAAFAATAGSAAASAAAPVLSYSAAPDRSGPAPLAGATVTAPLYAFVTGAGVARVVFRLDDRAPVLEREAPFDLGGTDHTRASRPARPVTPAPGAHRLTAEVTLTDGSTATLSAGFTAARRTGAGVVVPFLFGSFRDVEKHGLPRDVFGHFVNRSSWDDVAGARYIHADASGVPQWIAKHNGKRALNEATTMIPKWPGNGSSATPLLREGASGRRDGAYVSQGRALAKHGPDRVFARMQWEFNMHPAGQDREAWKACWRRAYPRIHEGFKEAARPGQTLSIGWTTNAGPPDPEPYYPGDEFVDAIGMDRYLMRWGTTDPTFEQVRDVVLDEKYSLNWLRRFAAEHRKPTFIGEIAQVKVKGRTASASMHGLGDEPRIIDALFDWVDSCTTAKGGPGIQYVQWFNVDDGGVGTHLGEQPRTVARLRERIAAAKSLTSP